MAKKKDAQVVIVKERGITCKGYGHVAKRVMTDPQISISAKGIYAYLSSMAGSGESSFTRRSKILYDLAIGDEAYDNNIAKLEKRGYIIKAQGRNPDGSFGSAVIEFIMLPSHLKDEILQAQEQETAPTAYSGTIYALGYGTVPKLVMQDREISVKAKGLYAYFCAYAGPNAEVFPSRDRILSELHIYRDGYDSYRKELERKNYITTIRRHVDGLLSGNFFRLNHFPDRVETAQKVRVEFTRKEEHSPAAEGNHQWPGNPGTVDQRPENPGTVHQWPENPDTVTDQRPGNPCTDNQWPENQWPEKPGTAIYSNTNNNLTNNSISTTSPTNTILYDRLIDLVREKISYRILLFAYDGDRNAVTAIETIVAEIVKVLTARESRVMIAKQVIQTSAAQEVLLQVSNEAVVNVVERYLVYCGDIREPGPYLLSAVYNEICCPTRAEEDETERQ